MSNVISLYYIRHGTISSKERKVALDPLKMALYVRTGHFRGAHAGGIRTRAHIIRGEAKRPPLTGPDSVRCLSSSQFVNKRVRDPASLLSEWADTEVGHREACVLARATTILLSSPRKRDRDPPYSVFHSCRKDTACAAFREERAKKGGGSLRKGENREVKNASGRPSYEGWTAEGKAIEEEATPRSLR